MFVYESPRHKTDGCRIVLSLSARLLRATMLSALARRAVPATASRLSSATTAGGARRAMGSAQSFVSLAQFFGAQSCSAEAADAGTVCTHTTNGFCFRDPLCVWVLDVNWAMESTGNCTVDVCMHAMCLSVLNRSPFCHRFFLFPWPSNFHHGSTSTPPTILSRPSSISTKRTTNELKW